MDSVKDIWKDNEVLIDCYNYGPRKEWVVVCPVRDTYKPGQTGRAKEAELAGFATLDEAKEFCEKSGLRLVNWVVGDY